MDGIDLVSGPGPPPDPKELGTEGVRVSALTHSLPMLGAEAGRPFKDGEAVVRILGQRKHQKPYQWHDEPVTGSF